MSPRRRFLTLRFESPAPFIVPEVMVLAAFLRIAFADVWMSASRRTADVDGPVGFRSGDRRGFGFGSFGPDRAETGAGIVVGPGSDAFRSGFLPFPSAFCEWAWRLHGIGCYPRQGYEGRPRLRL